MNILTLELKNVFGNPWRFFDELFNTDEDADEKIDKGKKKIEEGKTNEGEADILEGTAQKIKDKEEEQKEDE